MYINTKEDRAAVMLSDNSVANGLIAEMSHIPASYLSPEISAVFSA